MKILLIIIMQLIIVPLTTIRVILVVKGKVKPASLIGGVEAFIYITSLSLVFSDLKSYYNILAYAIGYSIGVLLGGFIEKKLAIGYRNILVNLPKYNQELIDKLQDDGFGVTVFRGEGRERKERFRLDILVKRTREKELISKINEIEPEAFLVAYEPTSFKGGYLVKQLKINEFNKDNLKRTKLNKNSSNKAKKIFQRKFAYDQIKHIEDVRKKFYEYDKKRDENLSISLDIVRYNDILYGDNKKYNLLDVYSLKDNTSKKSPVIIIVHGGAFVYGDKEIYQHYGMHFSKRGFKVINFSYKLAPEYKFPNPIIDLDNVVKWMINNQDKYGFDISNVCAVGDSAGATILGLYSTILINKIYRDSFNHLFVEEFNFNKISLNCGIYNFSKKSIDNELKNLLEAFLVKNNKRKQLKKLNFYNYINGDFPKTYIMTSSEDFLKKQSLFFCDKLFNKNVYFIFEYLSINNKELEHDFHCDMNNSYGEYINNKQCDFFLDELLISR